MTHELSKARINKRLNDDVVMQMPEKLRRFLKEESICMFNEAQILNLANRLGDNYIDAIIESMKKVMVEQSMKTYGLNYIETVYPEKLKELTQ